MDGFEQMHFKPDILTGMKLCCFEFPSEIQKKSIVTCIKGQNTVIRSPIGTGKTSASILSMLQNIDYNNKQCQVIVLCPTRELAQSIKAEVTRLGRHTGVRCHVCLEQSQDGELSTDKKTLSDCHIVVGTPTSLLEVIRKKIIDPDCVKMIVFDDLDEILSRNFTERILEIRHHLKTDVQTIAVLTTLGERELDFINQIMPDSVLIEVGDTRPSLNSVRLFYVQVEKEEWKLETLTELLQMLWTSQAMVYCNSEIKADWLAEEMLSCDWLSGVLHSNMDQKERDLIMREFRSGLSRVLITTDLLARGIDVQQVSLVINYDLPANRENYIRRIERIHTPEKKPLLISLITNEDKQKMTDIELHYNTHIDELPANVADLV